VNTAALCAGRYRIRVLRDAIADSCRGIDGAGLRAQRRMHAELRARLESGALRLATARMRSGSCVALASRVSGLRRYR
jgi:hypothetical protein